MTAVEPVTTLAVPFTPSPPEKYSHIVEKCVAHRPWFSDQIWDSGPEYVRTAVHAHLADAFNNGKIWEVWRGSALVGILLVNELVPFQDGRCHFLFFDNTLSDKFQLCFNLMGWCFDHIPVDVLRVEIPTYARALLKFVRKLGFRYEAEDRPFSWPQNGRRLSADEAKLGSRKHHAITYKGESCDVLLLSITAGEYAAVKEQSHGWSQSNKA
jgi:hypothetical protein